MKLSKRILCLVVAIMMLCSVCFAETQEEQQQESREMRIFETVVGITQMEHLFPEGDEVIFRNALYEVFKNDPSKLEDALEGAFNSFDSYTRYIRSEDYAKTMEDVTGNYVGVGVSLSMEHDNLYVSSPFAGSPADEAGILGGDAIVAVNGENIQGKDINYTVQLIRGAPGTNVTITVLRNGVHMDFTMPRREIKMNPVTYNYVEDDIGYIKLSAFNSNVQDYMQSALDDLKSQGVKKIILDLRDNYGGEVTGALAAASFFIPDEKLIMTQTFKNERDNREFYSTSKTVDFKVCLLINGNSASASEIVAGAIKDNKAGPLVGVRSYGKGTVQYVQRIITGGAIWYTVAAYLTPSGEWIHEKGIEPDYEIENVPEKLDTTDVPRLNPRRVLQHGDTGADVAALKVCLSTLGVKNLTMDDRYDDRTFEAVKNIQAFAELYPYGVADINTQLKINVLLDEAEYIPDRQYDKAVEIAREM